MRKNNLLPVSILVLISGAMFSSHFGVGDLIFPPILGRDAGIRWFIAALGYMIVNSVGVWLAYLACAHQNKSLTGIATNLFGNVFGKIYTAIPILITVLFILPRVSSATHEMAVMPLLPGIPLWLTLAVFFLLCYYVAFTRTTVMDKLGKLLAPVLILFVVILVVKGVATPLSTPQDPVSSNVFSRGMLEAYNTMNAIAALLFGGWVLHELSMRNIKTKEDQSVNLNIIGISAAILLGITSTALVYLGASSGSFYPDAPIGILSTKISLGLLGQVGLVSFAIIMAFSCLTTAAAIISMAGDMLLEMTNGKLSYRLTVTLATIAGFVLGLVGLSRIINYTVPWLVLIYPSIVVIILSGLYYKFEKIRKAVVVGVIVALFFGLGDMFAFYGLTGNFITQLASKLPLGGQGVGWILPTIIIMIVAQMIFKSKNEEVKNT